MDLWIESRDTYEILASAIVRLRENTLNMILFLILTFSLLKKYLF